MACLIDECIQAADCNPFQPGGFSRLWLANLAERTLLFAECGGISYGKVEGITLTPGAMLYTVDFSKETGLLLDSTGATSGAGFTWTHTLTIPLKDFLCTTMGLAEKLVGAELTVFAQRKSGDIVVVGIGEDGLRISAATITNGRLGPDARVNERTLTLSDSYYQVPFIAAGAPTDPQAQIQFNVDYLNALVNCSYASYIAA